MQNRQESPFQESFWNIIPGWRYASDFGALTKAPHRVRLKRIISTEPSDGASHDEGPWGAKIMTGSSACFHTTFCTLFSLNFVFEFNQRCLQDAFNEFLFKRLPISELVWKNFA